MVALAAAFLMLPGCATSQPSVEEASPAPVVRQPTQPCDFHENVLKHLAKRYGERPIAMGLNSAGALVEVIATADGETWTIIVTRPDGWSCLVTAGEGWRVMESAEGTAL